MSSKDIAIIMIMMMVGRRGIMRDIKKLNFIKSYKGQEIADSHECPLPNGIWHIEEEEYFI